MNNTVQGKFFRRTFLHNYTKGFIMVRKKMYASVCFHYCNESPCSIGNFSCTFVKRDRLNDSHRLCDTCFLIDL